MLAPKGYHTRVVFESSTMLMLMSLHFPLVLEHWIVSHVMELHILMVLIFPFICIVDLQGISEYMLAKSKFGVTPCHGTWKN